MSGNAIKISETQAAGIDDETLIRPGDRVMIDGRWARVIEVYPEPDDVSRLMVYRTSGIHSGVDTVYAEGVTDFEPREGSSDHD